MAVQIDAAPQKTDSKSLNLTRQHATKKIASPVRVRLKGMTRGENAPAATVGVLILDYAHRIGLTSDKSRSNCPLIGNLSEIYKIANAKIEK